VKIRYRSAEAMATLTPLKAGTVRVEFDAPQAAVTPGQAAVFYEGDLVVGGGWIERGND
jgi:tRNA-specific 2-thiouridylase